MRCKREPFIDGQLALSGRPAVESHNDFHLQQCEVTSPAEGADIMGKRQILALMVFFGCRVGASHVKFSSSQLRDDGKLL